MKLWLDRPDITGSIKDFLQKVSFAFQLGTIIKFTRFPLGYQELNIKLKTSQGVYVVKTFSNEKSLSRVKENVQGYLEFPKLGVPMPKLKITKEGNPILITKGKRQEVFTCVMDYFWGKTFLKLPITTGDIVTIARFMAQMHQSKLKPAHYYDTLGIVNFKDVYHQQAHVLPPLERKDIQRTLEEFRSIDLSKFRQSVIHGTLERENVLKDAQGNYCVLDLGCMDYNASIVDIATFLANFTIDMNVNETIQSIRAVVAEYQKFHTLTANERLTLPLLIKTQYSILLIGMMHAIQIEHDDSKQTKRWLEFGKHGLKKFQDIHNRI